MALKMKKTHKKRALRTEQLQCDALDSSDESDSSTSLLASDTPSEVQRSAAARASTPLFKDEDDDDASTVVTQQEDPTPSQLKHSPLPSTQTATQRGRKATTKQGMRQRQRKREGP